MCTFSVGLTRLRITLYVIPWYQMSGPLELFGTLAGITAALMSLTVPMYIWGKRYRRYWGHHNALVMLRLEKDPSQ